MFWCTSSEYEWKMVDDHTGASRAILALSRDSIDLLSLWTSSDISGRRDLYALYKFKFRISE